MARDTVEAMTGSDLQWLLFWIASSVLVCGGLTALLRLVLPGGLGVAALAGLVVIGAATLTGVSVADGPDPSCDDLCASGALTVLVTGAVYSGAQLLLVGAVAARFAWRKLRPASATAHRTSG